MNGELPTCDQSADCHEPVTHIEDSGWVYCTAHGVGRRQYGYRVRKLRPHELNRLRRGEQVTRY